MSLFVTPKRPEKVLPVLNDRKAAALDAINLALDALLFDERAAVLGAVIQEREKIRVIIAKLESDFPKMFTNPYSLQGAITVIGELRRRLGP